MARMFDAIEDQHRRFIEAQHIFFVATAAETERVNVSPKGMDSLRVLGPDRIVWLNLTGSGNETAGHLARVNRITLMWCGFERQAMIMRAFGTARTLHPRDAGWGELAALFPAHPGARQIFDVAVTGLQTSCGYGVPFMDYAGERPTLAEWAERNGEDGLRAYRIEKNRTTIDGLPTGLGADGT